MVDLKQKIKNTALFTSDEKVEILVALDTFSESDTAQLEDIVDEYDRKFVQITHTFKQNMMSELDAIEKKSANMHDAVEKIKSGLNAVVATTS